jgi:phthiocerol/phenolphthiocerol synthesis type-I polyketide synthase E
MTQTTSRIDQLTPERRRLLELLTRKDAPRAAVREPPRFVESRGSTHHASYGGTPLLTIDLGQSPEEAKAGYRQFYDAVNQQLNTSEFGAFSFFLNYGYVANELPQHAVVALPEHYVNRNSLKLVLELLGDCPLAGKHVLDVGSGRGGTAHVVSEFFKPDSVTGVDLSPGAIAFCRSTHKRPGVRFFEGDAERLPFDDEVFDVVTNVESSHSYPNIEAFYCEVSRVLVTGGYFLYTDLLPDAQMNSGLDTLTALGFLIEQDRDITPNVLLSCDEIARNRLGAFESANNQSLMREFLATPESQVYQGMRTRQWTYRIIRARKRGADAA